MTLINLTTLFVISSLLETNLLAYEMDGTKVNLNYGLGLQILQHSAFRFERRQLQSHGRSPTSWRPLLLQLQCFD